jgi:DNA-binding LytR/AlgR family response regulator
VNIPINFVTGAVDNIEKAYSAGDVDYVVNPIQTLKLHMRVYFHLERMMLMNELKQVNLKSHRII